MPLIINILQSGFQDLLEHPPLSEQDVIRRWETLWTSYVNGLLPAPTVVEIGSCIQTFVAALTGISVPNQAPQVLKGALATFAAQVAVGQTTGSTTGVVPPSPWEYGFPRHIHGTQAASDLASSIDTWLRTGSVTIAGVTTPWS